MPTPGLLYPGAPPVINGSLVTLEWLMKRPTVVQKMLSDITLEGFMSDQVFSSGDAQGGAVIFDQITENDLYPDGDPDIIEPGSQFPLVNDVVSDPKVAAVLKRGSAIAVTYENVRRNQMDVLQRGLLKLKNASIRKHDALGVAALHGELLIPTSAGLDWDATNDKIAQINAVKSKVKNTDLSYEVDTAILHPDQELQLLNDTAIRNALPRENTQLNPLTSGELAKLCKIENWFVTNRQTSGVIDFVQKKIVGSVRDEVPFYTRVVDQPERERYLIMAGRLSAHIITDPFAAYRLTGLNG